jgi:hypothetical protein
VVYLFARKIIKGRERFSRGKRGTTARGREEGRKKSGERSLFLDLK